MSDVVGHSEFTPYPESISESVHKRLFHTVPEYKKLHAQLARKEKELADTQESLSMAETDRDWLQADFELITNACRSAGWERSVHNHPTTGDDIGAFILQLQAQNVELREVAVQARTALNSLETEALGHHEQGWSFRNELIFNLSEVIKSTGTAHIKKQLADVERVLKRLKHIEKEIVDFDCCFSCGRVEAQEHYEDCAIITLIKDFESKRDKLKEALK